MYEASEGARILQGNLDRNQGGSGVVVMAREREEANVDTDDKHVL